MFLMRHELGLMWKEFRFSLKRSLTIVLITQVIVMAVAVNIALEFILSALFNTYPTVAKDLVDSFVKAGLTESRISDIVYLVFFLFLVASLIRGILSSGFGLLFTRVDENIISSSPMAPHALYIAKKFKRFMIHILGVTTLLVAVFPAISRIGFTGIRLVYLFVVLLTMIEFYGLTENTSYSVSRMLTMRHRRFKAIGLFLLIVLMSYVVVLPLLVLLGVDMSPITLLIQFYPPYMFSKIATLSPSFDIMSGTLSIVVVGIVFFILASSTAKFGLKRWSSSPRLAQTRGRFLQLRKNGLNWKPGSKNDVNLVLMKDFWVTIRNPTRFLIPLVIALALMFFTLQLQLMLHLPQLQPTLTMYTEPIFLFSTYLVAVFILSPAWDSFAGERRTVYLLKTAPIDPSNIIKGKYLFALIKSLLYVAPIVVAISFVLPHTGDISIALLEVAPILLVSNALGVLASVSYPPAYRGVGPPPFLIVLGLPLFSAVLTAIIPISFMTYYNDPTLFVFVSIGMLLYAFLVVAICIKRATRSFIRLQEI